MEHAELRRYAIRHAMCRPHRFLAAHLAEFTDEVLATLLACPTGEVWRLRLAHRPRPDLWDTQVADIAATIGANAKALDSLLRRLGLGPS
jgi:hypothetical protein